MSNELVQQAIVRAVQISYDKWASQHPSLADVIDRISLTNRAVQSLKDTDQYRQAVDAYHRDLSQENLLNHLLELTGPVVIKLLTG